MMGFIMKNLLLILAYYSKRFHYNSSISSCNSKYLIINKKDPVRRLIEPEAFHLIIFQKMFL